MKKSVIITAAGLGRRMGGEIPKQFLTVGDRPVLIHTIAKFHKIDPDFELIVTIPESERRRWNELCAVHNFAIKHKVVAGGESRYQSIKNALEYVTGELVAIHDGVRPFVACNVVEDCFRLAEAKGTAVPVMELTESLREICGEGSEARNRSDYRLVQTPQVFRREIIRNAYAEISVSDFSDDASLAESKGHAIFLTEGNRENIKITTPFDLKIATLLLTTGA